MSAASAGAPARAATPWPLRPFLGYDGSPPAPPERIRLLERDEFSVFTRHGIRLALLFLTLWAIGVPAYVVLGEEILRAGILITAVGIVFSAIALWLPMRHLHRSVREAKRAELAKLRSAIGDARLLALDSRSSDADAAAARVPGLIAYERRIEEVHPSNLDSRILAQVGLYLLIPLGSWVAATLVERSVNTLLD